MQNIDFPFPHKGVIDTLPYSAKPGEYAIEALNVVSFDVAEDRIRGGRRPGTGRALRDPVALEGIPVRRMRQIILDSNTFVDPDAFFTDPFHGIGSGPTGEGPGAPWGWVDPEFYFEPGTPDPLPALEPGYLFV